MAWQKYGTNPELDKLVDHSYSSKHIEAARQGYGLDILINDKYQEVRREVAKQGYGLDVLINDECWEVRREVVKQGYGLDKLINDEDFLVREATAKHGYGLDKLINDKSGHVRVAVAEHGYGLDILINDEDAGVRQAVARQGYGLDKLVNDENWHVRHTIAYYLQEHNYKSIIDWAKANPDKVHDEINLQLITDLKDFICKIDDSSKLKIQSNYDNIDNFFIETTQDILVICTVDTKESIIKIEKSISDQKTSFKFIVDITNTDGDNFSIKSTIKSKEQLITNLNKTIEALSLYPEFSKYIDDLELLNK